MARTLQALAPWYGAKRQLADRIIAELGEHHSYCEPFAGSMSVLLAKPPCRMEIANDLHGDLINLARVVADEELSVQLFDRLCHTLFCQELYELAQKLLWKHPCGSGAISLERAYNYFVVSWMGRNGLAGTNAELTSGFCKRLTANGGDPATRFRNVVANIPAWFERLRHVTILSEDGIALCNRIEDKIGCAVYVDPPYLDKQASYRIDFTEAMHMELAEVLRRFKAARVVVSYYDHPRLDVLYLQHSWTKVAIDVQKNLAVQGGAAKAPEVLLVNGAPAGVIAKKGKKARAAS